MIATGQIAHDFVFCTAGDPDYAFTERIVAAQKRVISQSLEAIQQPRTSIGRGSLHDEVTALKQKPGGDIICFGGVSFGAGCWRPMSWTSCSSMSIPTRSGRVIQSSGSRARFSALMPRLIPAAS